MNAFTVGAEITALRRAALTEATRAIQAGEDTALVCRVFEEEYTRLTGDALPNGAWRRVEAQAMVCAAWLPCGVPDLTPPPPEVTPPTPVLPNGWFLERCDHTGHATRYGAYWQASGPRGQHTDPHLRPHSAAFWACRDEEEVTQ